MDELRPPRSEASQWANGPTFVRRPKAKSNGDAKPSDRVKSRCACNVAYEEVETRGFFKLTALTLLFTFGAVPRNEQRQRI